ncbi:MAG: glycoside hydrolase family 3 N-terminal domain-containing protein [bacterium]|nr:glycoside hydrolase family 3 N-terminal domain-containing protein [bacterium]
MKKIIEIGASMLAAAALMTGCGVNTARNDADSAQTDEISVKDMSLEEKAGQLFMVRCDAESMDKIMEKQPGGIIMFGADFQNLSENEVKDKINTYKDKSRLPLAVAVDEEGGTVVRVSSNPALSDEKFKSPQEYYNEGGMELVLEKEDKKCRMLKKLGINMNLAPVADVSVNEADFIYKRSLGRSAEETSQYVAAVVEEMDDNDIASCLKHFPGYGSNADTHTGTAVDERGMRSFEQSDFLPFMKGIEAGADAVLVSHNIVKCMDGENPASISPAVHEILRNKLKFDGIVMTDDMSMQAAAGYDEPYIRAVNAGNDMMIVTDFDTAYTEVLNGIREGKISEETVNKAVERILDWKEDLD